MNNQINVDKPVFVMGTGRCGLSPLMDLVAYHRSFAWPSQFNDRHPKNYKVSVFSRLVDLPFVNGSRLKYRKFPVHFEAFNLWNSFFHGFRRPFRDLTADDVTPHVRAKFRDAVYNIMKYQGKSSFIAEYSGWSRMGFMKAIFPEARFIHLVRDGRAVANSLTNVAWWMGWEGVYKWRWGVPDQELQEKLEQYDQSFLALAAVHWKILITNILAQSQQLSNDDVLLVRYEDLVSDPYQVAFRCIDFCDLDRDCQSYRKHLSTVKIIDANKKKFRIPAWRDNMSQKHIDMLDDILEEELVRLNYPVSNPTNGQHPISTGKVADLEPSRDPEVI